MNEKNKERMLDLLTDQVLFGLNAGELAELKELENLFPEFKGDNSLELTASAIGINSLESIEPMPNHLRAKILANADNFFKTETFVEETPKNILSFQPKLREVAPVIEDAEPAKIIEFKPQRKSWNNWLGWAVAAAACLALALNLWFTRVQNTPTEIAKVTPTPKVLPVSEQREQLLKEAEIIKADWTEANPKQPVGISGDVVWSNKDQKGYLRLRGLPKNDASQKTYQLWIFDANQDEKTPVDGGIFDANETGEIIIPINAKLKVGKPQMFAVTAEKAGGVVVSDRKNIVTIAKVST